MPSHEQSKQQNEPIAVLKWLDRTLIWISLICGSLALAFMTVFSVVNVLISAKR